MTFDLDIFALLPESETGSPIISLEPLYSVLRKRGFEVAAEHVMMHGTPVQFLVSPNELSDEAIQTAVAQELDGVPFRVMRPEHLCALWLQAGGAKRRGLDGAERSATIECVMQPYVFAAESAGVKPQPRASVFRGR